MAKPPIVIILAAGLGTRMKSKRTKMLHTVCGRPLICWSVATAREVGASPTVAVLGHQRDEVEAAVTARFGEGALKVAVQSEQKGTGHAVMCGLEPLQSEDDDRIAVIMSGDAPLFRSERVAALVAACEEADAGMALVSARVAPPNAYGRLVRDAAGKLERIVEERDATDDQRAIDEINAGFYAIRLGLLRQHIAGLTTDNAQGELYLTDVVAAVADRGGAAVVEVPFEEIQGVNDRVDLAGVETSARRRIVRDWMRRGVSFADPDGAFIEADVAAIGEDTWIGPGVCIRGNSRVGRGVHIDAGCVLENTEVDDDVVLKPYTVLTEARVGQRAQIGPFTHGRPQTRIDEDAKVGNFVETKKTHIMAGAKASHLSYLGDASVGAGANIGAGTITCNYDGFGKHRTVIEADVFIGSDTQLVAPVTVHKGAYVGAGSTVTRDVPGSSLALTRVKQVNVEGWAERFREAQGKRKKKGE